MDEIQTITSLVSLIIIIFLILISLLVLTKAAIGVGLIAAGCYILVAARILQAKHKEGEIRLIRKGAQARRNDKERVMLRKGIVVFIACAFLSCGQAKEEVADRSTQEKEKVVRGTVSVESVPNTEAVTKASVDSVALYRELKQRTELAKILIARARAEFKKENYAKCEAMADSARSVIYSKEVQIRAIPNTGNPIIQDAWNTADDAGAVWGNSYRARQEIAWDSAGWFRYDKGTFERKVEFDILSWYINWMDSPVGDDTPTFDYSFLRNGSIKRIIKTIKFSSGILTINMRAEPNDIVDVRYSQRTTQLKHPIDFMRDFKGLTHKIFSEPGLLNRRMRIRYKEVNEIVFTLYYPGKIRETEIPIAKFGLTRSVGESVRWEDISFKDGTFQDFLKEKGTYWLHHEVPDMGTPISLIR